MQWKGSDCIHWSLLLYYIRTLYREKLSYVTWNLKASWMDQIGVSVELLRKKAFLSIYIYIFAFTNKYFICQK
jgi:hypothetical protein